jgi:hypothetical protein
VTTETGDSKSDIIFFIVLSEELPFSEGICFPAGGVWLSPIRDGVPTNGSVRVFALLTKRIVARRLKPQNHRL